MLIFSHKSDITNMLNWLQTSDMFPPPELVWAEYFGKANDPESEIFINYDNKFSLGFRGVTTAHDVFRVDIDRNARIRVVRIIKAKLISGEYETTAEKVDRLFKDRISKMAAELKEVPDVQGQN